MQVFSDIDKLQAELSKTAGASKLSFVPTMGYLHEGHLKLVETAKKLAEKTIVSIFVNPLQFNNKMDLAKYPRNLENDRSLLEKAEVDYLFAPQEHQILPGSSSIKTYKPAFAENFEAKFRPGHFEGVCTIVSLLFSIIEPDSAVFGEKDFQQLRIIEQMTKDLSFPIQIIRAPTVRDTNGLALSSRNSRLSHEDKKKALSLSRALKAAAQAYSNGITSSPELKNIALNEIKKETSVELEYLALVNETSFEEVIEADSSSRLLLAAYVGGVRLIDNTNISAKLIQ